MNSVICCGKPMFAAGGTVDGLIQSWKCDICGCEVAVIEITPNCAPLTPASE